MWYETEYSIMPEELDTISSSKFVYIRKDIEAMEKEGDIVYKCKEQRLTKDDVPLHAVPVVNQCCRIVFLLHVWSADVRIDSSRD